MCLLRYICLHKHTKAVVKIHRICQFKCTTFETLKLWYCLKYMGSGPTRAIAGREEG